MKLRIRSFAGAVLLAAGFARPAQASGEGIAGPASVQEGATSTIQVSAPDSRWIEVTDSLTRDTFKVQVGADRIARFELPSTAVAGTTLLVVDKNDPDKGTVIAVVPATSA